MAVFMPLVLRSCLISSLVWLRFFPWPKGHGNFSHRRCLFIVVMPFTQIGTKYHSLLNDPGISESRKNVDDYWLGIDRGGNFTGAGVHLEKVRWILIFVSVIFLPYHLLPVKQILGGIFPPFLLSYL